MIDFFETASLLSLLAQLPLGDLLWSWFTRGLDPLPSEELFVAETELLFLPSFGDIGRVVGIYKIEKYINIIRADILREDQVNCTSGRGNNLGWPTSQNHDMAGASYARLPFLTSILKFLYSH